jgi:hypothetical protein
MELTQSFTALLQEFACVFTAPTHLTFIAVVTGWCLSFRHRYVTELIQSSGSTHTGHHSRYHRFFSQAAWCLDQLGMVLARRLVRTFAATGTIELAVDDTLGRKRGLTIHGTGMHHDPLISSRAMKLVSWGHDWVVICLLLCCPFWAPTKVWALPIAFRLYRNRQGITKGKKKRQKDGKAKKARKPPGQRTRPELALELLSLVAAWFPDRQLMADGAGAVQPDRALVSPAWSSPGGVSRPSVASQEGRAVVCRPVEHATPPELAGENARCVCQTQWLEKAPCPNNRIGQPRRPSSWRGGKCS